MRILAPLLLLWLAPTVFAAPVPKELRRADDLPRLAGMWTKIGSRNGGGNIAPPDGSRWEFTLDGRATIHRPQGAPAGGIQFALVQKTDPKGFDWICPWGEWYGVYELTDDTFTMYISSKKDVPDKGRNLLLKPGPGIEMYSFQRLAVAK